MANRPNNTIAIQVRASSFGPSTTHTGHSNAWPHLSDQLHARKIAEQKLRRQNERILQTDQVLASISSSKPKGRSRAKAWKPFDLTESSDELASSDDQRGPTPTPFLPDIYAQAYQPYTTSRHSHDALGMQFADYDDWQYATTNTKALASGLNAHQIQLDVSTPTVAASYNKREINDVFGNELPSPSYCTANTGGSNGQVQFCIHPNGDVSAHQWSGSLYQWINIGQYSNIRKKTEGQMANERLIGESETQSLQQNTLAYFRLVGKQREAQVTGNALGTKEIQTALSNSSARGASPYNELTHNTEGENSTPIEKLNSFGTTSNKTKTRITSHETLHHSPTPSPFASRNDQSSSTSVMRSRLADLKFGSMPVSQILRASQSRTYSSHDFAKYDHASGTLERSVSFPTQDERQSGDVRASHMMDSPTLLEGSPFDSYFPPASMNSVISRKTELDKARSLYTAPAFTPAIPPEIQSPSYDISGVYSNGDWDKTGSRPTPAGRGAYKDMLQKTADSATARGSYVTQKTPPEQLPGFTGEQSNISRAEKPVISVGVESLNFKAAFAPPELRKPSAFRKEVLDGSESDGPWTRRPVDVVTVKLPPMANEELALLSRPTPQIFEGPFFQGLTELSDNTNKEERYDKQLSAWFHSGKVKAERHDDLFDHIMAQAKSSDLKVEAAAPSRNPGVIGRPKTETKTEAIATPKVKAEPKFNETLTRLFIPVIENLKFFVEGPESARRGWDARFVTPPEWCVDKSEKGNTSFFEKEWVQPPQRIGRDQRFTPAKGRFRNRMALDF